MRAEDTVACEWYLQEVAAENWSVRQPEHNIHSCYYQRMLTSGKTEQTPSVAKIRGLRICKNSTFAVEFRNLSRLIYLYIV